MFIKMGKLRKLIRELRALYKEHSQAKGSEETLRLWRQYSYIREMAVDEVDRLVLKGMRKD